MVSPNKNVPNEKHPLWIVDVNVTARIDKPQQKRLQSIVKRDKMRRADITFIEFKCPAFAIHLSLNTVHLFAERHKQFVFLQFCAKLIDIRVIHAGRYNFGNFGFDFVGLQAILIEVIQAKTVLCAQIYV